MPYFNCQNRLDQFSFFDITISFKFLSSRIKVYLLVVMDHAGNSSRDATLSGGNLTPDTPYIVLIGDVGTGKSTVVEKVTDVVNRSSSSDLSFTRTSEQFWTFDEEMVICDTPGSNAVQDKLGHNMHIAHALNFNPVWRIMIITKAETRMDNTVDGIRKYAERLMEFPIDLIGALVTHMDTVNWSDEDFAAVLDKELGIETVVFSGFHTPREVLLDDIKRICEKGFKITIDEKNFLKVSKINDSRLKILRCTNREVENFKMVKAEFDKAKSMYTQKKDQVDLFFEFQAYMRLEIELAQKRVAEENGFTFYGEEAANEAGHIANMANQMRLVLYDVRVATAGYQSAHGVKGVRRCPHCSLVWTKVEGCDGATTCGSRPSTALDVRDPSFGVLGTFTFKRISNIFSITKSGTRTITNIKSPSKLFGCGNTIVWNDMAIVELPSDVQALMPVTMDDNVPVLSDTLPGARAWQDILKDLDDD